MSPRIKSGGEHRLERARRLLGDPRCAHLDIGEIARNAGFSDLSYFNRTFRRRFAATPGEVRNRPRFRSER